MIGVCLMNMQSKFTSENFVFSKTETSVLVQTLQSLI